MNSPKLSSELRRFIQSIASIPHLEAIMLLRGAPAQVWDMYTVSQRLYLKPEQAGIVLNDLCVSGICKALPETQGQFIYSPASDELSRMLDELAHYYSYNLIEVTNMIHSKSNAGQRMRKFSDAFKFNKDK